MTANARIERARARITNPAKQSRAAVTLSNNAAPYHETGENGQGRHNPEGTNNPHRITLAPDKQRRTGEHHLAREGEHRLAREGEHRLRPPRVRVNYGSTVGITLHPAILRFGGRDCGDSPPMTVCALEHTTIWAYADMRLGAYNDIVICA
jgi:hypothetical protein